MLKWSRLIAFVILFGFTTSLVAAEPDARWSKPSNGLQAKLEFVKTDGFNGTPFIVTYLELRNVSNLANVLEVPLKIESMAFELRDETGKVVPPTNGPYDGMKVELGILRLPHDSTLRFNIASRGAGVMKDQAALLDLGSSNNWTFASGDKHSYSLTARFTIDKSKDRIWAGTIEIPQTPLPSLAK